MFEPAQVETAVGLLTGASGPLEPQRFGLIPRPCAVLRDTRARHAPATRRAYRADLAGNTCKTVKENAIPRVGLNM
jgi:hypothetical protein